MFVGVAIGIGLASPVGPVGVTPQLSRTASVGVPLPDIPFESPFFPALEGEEFAGLPPVLTGEAAGLPVGSEVVGTTAGTEGHAKS
jgi:hypothetical protein